MNIKSSFNGFKIERKNMKVIIALVIMALNIAALASAHVFRVKVSSETDITTLSSRQQMDYRCSVAEDLRNGNTLSPEQMTCLKKTLCVLFAEQKTYNAFATELLTGERNYQPFSGFGNPDVAREGGLQSRLASHPVNDEITAGVQNFL